MRERSRPDASDAARPAALATLASSGLAVAGLLLAGATGPPYLSADGVNGWIVVFAAGLFAALLAIPFALEARLRDRLPERDARWDRVVPIWGAAALGVLAIAVLAGAAAGFSGDSLAGSAGLIAAIESGLVVVALAFVFLSG